MPKPERTTAVAEYLQGFQDRVCRALEAEEPVVSFREDEIDREGGGTSRPRVLEGGGVVERAAVNFSHTLGEELPGTATSRRPDLSGAYEAVSVSLIVHPRNPFAPTCHSNLRYFEASGKAGRRVWWFGGGFDLTPFYGFEEDAVHWHRAAREACRPLGDGAWQRYKHWCDEYFRLPHRGEARGIGGLFFDDLRAPDFETCFRFLQSVGAGFLEGYLPILRRRKDLPYSEREREFQLIRRGRYVEFNLLHDRGTKFGLQAGGRVESILGSMPPLVAWRYDWSPEPGSREAELLERYLRPRDWLADESSPPD